MDEKEKPDDFEEFIYDDYADPIFENFDFADAQGQQRIFIVEGPDGSGKTSVCNFLNRFYHYPVYHLTWFEEEEKMDRQFERVFQLIHSLVNYPGYRGIIFDRFVLSNILYTKVFNNGKVCGYIEKIENLMKAMNYHYEYLSINCLVQDKETWMKNFEKLAETRDEMFAKKLDGMSKLYDEYKNYFRTADPNKYGLGNPTFDYDYTKPFSVTDGKTLVQEFYRHTDNWV